MIGKASYLSNEATEFFTTEVPEGMVVAATGEVAGGRVYAHGEIKRTPPINFRPKAKGFASVNTAHRAASVHDRKMREGDIEAAEAFLADTTSQWCRAIPNAERRMR